MAFFVGLPVGTRDMKRMGVEKLLDYVKENAQVNAVILNTINTTGYTYFRPHEEFYLNTILRPTMSADDEDFDLLAEVLVPAHERGIAVYGHTLCYDSVASNERSSKDANGFVRPFGAHAKNLRQVLEVDVFGRTMDRPCINNPDYREYYRALVDDQLRSYPIDGINFNIERYGPMETTLLGNFGSGRRDRKATSPRCFCPHCIRSAQERGINVERAKEGYLKLLEFSERTLLYGLSRGDEFTDPFTPLSDHIDTGEPADGYIFEFLRIIFRYSEILAWDQMWHDNLQDFFKGIYGTVKAVGADRKLGWHVWHPRMYSPFERALYDIHAMRRYSDWIKPKMDHNCAGYRYRTQIRKLTQAFFPDKDLQRAYQAINTVLGWNEQELENMPVNGMDYDYIRRDTQSYIKNTCGEVPIYPGIGLDMPSGPMGQPGYHPTEPEQVKKALFAAAEAGAKGVVLSRQFAEMQHKNIAAAGEALKEIQAWFKG